MSAGMHVLILSLTAGLSVAVVVVSLWSLFGDVAVLQFRKLCNLYKERYVFLLQYPDKPEMVVGAYLGVVVAVTCLLFFVSVILGFVAIAFGIVAPVVFLAAKIRARRAKIDDVLPSMLQQLGANTRNIGSVSLALQEVSKTAPKPLDYELTLISRQEQELKSFVVALDQARTRINTRWFDIVCSVLITGDQKGGHISTSMQNLSRVFTQLKTMQKRIDTATSQGRMSIKVMLVMPVVIVGVVYLINPAMVELATVNIAGKVMLGMAVMAYFLSLGLTVWLSSVKI